MERCTDNPVKPNEHLLIREKGDRFDFCLGGGVEVAARHSSEET